MVNSFTSPFILILWSIKWFGCLLSKYYLLSSCWHCVGLGVIHHHHRLHTKLWNFKPFFFLRRVLADQGVETEETEPVSAHATRVSGMIRNIYKHNMGGRMYFYMNSYLIITHEGTRHPVCQHQSQSVLTVHLFSLKSS